MASKPRDPIIQDSPETAGGSVKRGDLLNGQPRTKSISGGSANFTSQRDRKAGWPVPDSPYGKD